MSQPAVSFTTYEVLDDLCHWETTIYHGLNTHTSTAMTIYGDISSILLIDNDITLIQCGIIVTDDKRRLLYVT
jgi:hypothetical protein